MDQQKKKNRLIVLAVCLLMLATLVMPMNVEKASAATADLQNPRTALDGTVTWDCVWFGHYPQSSDGKGGFNNAPIKWRVLSVDGNEALLLADKNLDGEIPYNEEDEDVTWETCTMRSWLNGYGSGSNQNGIDYTSDNFIDRAFTASEQNAILQKTVVNTDNPEYGTEGGNNTLDKLFLPSIAEMTTPVYGFPSDPDEYADSRVAKNTAYTASKNSNMSNDGATEWYWLRSPGDYSSLAALVDYGGDVIRLGSYVHDTEVGVRPALRLDLNSNLWSDAGTVSSDGAVDEISLQQKPTTPVVKVSQTITAKSFTKTYGNKAFSLGAKAKTKLSYKSSNSKVATVSSTGRVNLKGPGKATITITATATSQYNAATKKITIIVKPKKATLKKAKSTKKRTLKVMWKRDTKATGYQVVVAQNKKFKKGKKTALIKKNKTTSRTFKKLKSRKNYYYKVRAYKQVGKTKLYGSYSKVKRIRVR